MQTGYPTLKKLPFLLPIFFIIRGRGKKKRSKTFNFLKRLSRYEDVLTFFLERDSSFFTNNAAEREIRNVKIKSKIQGVFRSDLGSKIYCRVRG